ncbi:MAG: hypothetical protein WC890_02325 [Candidatus Margulisiibacteriota bacterium]
MAEPTVVKPARKRVGLEAGREAEQARGTHRQPSRLKTLNPRKPAATNIPYADRPLRLSDVYESPESIINRLALEAKTPRERRAIDEFRNYYEQNRLEYNRAYEIERSRGVSPETFCRRVYEGFVETQQANLSAKIAKATAVDRFMQAAKPIQTVSAEVRMPIVVLARIGEITQMPAVRSEVVRSVITLLVSASTSPVVQSALTDRANFIGLIDAASSISTKRSEVIQLNPTPKSKEVTSASPSLETTKASSPESVSRSEQIVMDLVETGKAMQTITQALSTAPIAERSEVTQAAATIVHEAIRADNSPERVQQLVAGCQLVIEAGQAEQISRLNSADIVEIAQIAEIIKGALAESNSPTLVQAVANLAEIDVTVARSVTRSAAIEAGLETVPILVTARDNSTSLFTTEILLSALSAVARQSVQERAENVVRVSFDGKAVESENVVPLTVRNAATPEIATDRLPHKEREATEESKAIVASALQAVEVAATAGKLTTALAALKQAAAVAKEQGVELALNPLTLGSLYAGIILDRPLLRTDSQIGKFVGKAEEKWSASNLEIVKEVLEAMMNSSLTRGVRSVSVASLAAEFFLSGIIMRKVKADKETASKIIAFLAKHKTTVNSLLALIENNNTEEVVNFFDQLILEANQIAGFIPNPQRPVQMVTDPYSPEILEQALEVILQARYSLTA